MPRSNFKNYTNIVSGDALSGESRYSFDNALAYGTSKLNKTRN